MRYALLLLLCLACRAPVQTAVPPQSVPSIQGAVPIYYVDTIPAMDSTRFLVGGYDYYSRRILIRQEARRNPTTVNLIAWHEWCHVVLVDAGFKMDSAVIEMICDAFAAARTSERKPGR